MGFLLTGGVSGARQKQEDKLFHRLECKLCPLDKLDTGAFHHMKATGAEKPLLYFIGEAPGKTEAEEGEQFVGESGELLRARIPEKFEHLIRWNNTIRCRPPKNRTPEHIEVECCRPSIVRDIEQSKPRAIVGFGGVPLTWATGFSGVTMWRGRRTPVKIGSHTCWFYPMLHPAYLLRQRRGQDSSPTTIGSEDERMFVMDLKRVFAEIDKLPPAEVHGVEHARVHIETVVDCTAAGLKRIEAGLHRLAKMPVVGLDYETNALRPYGKPARILSAAVGSESYSIAFPFHHPEAKWTAKQLDALTEIWTGFLSECNAKIAVHNLAFELEWTGYTFGNDLLRGPDWEDTASQAAILDERRGKTKPGPFSLEFLVQQYFGFNLKKLSNLDRKNLANVPLRDVLVYNALDAKYHCMLWAKQDALIEKEGLRVPYDLALRRVPTVVLSQLKGAPVDQKEVRELRVKYRSRIESLEKAIADHPAVLGFCKRHGRKFNPGSNPDTVELFHKWFACRECEVKDKYSKDTKLSVDVDVLKAISKGQNQEAAEVAETFLQLRSATKLNSTYIEPMVDDAENTLIHDDGLMHTIFNTYWAETSRLSSEEPNLQNYPKRGAEAKEVRRPVKPKKGQVIVAVDYGQIEARVIAMFTKDILFVKALWEDYDVHMEWAQRIAKAYPDRVGGRTYLTDTKVMKDFRTDIKNQWTFPLFFNATLPSVAGYLSIPERVIRPLYDEFWRQFSGVRNWQEEQMAFYRKYGWVESLTGRRRHGPLTSNQIVNSPVQGTAAEIVLDAMCRLSETGDPALQPEINIHDDLTYLRVPEEDVEAHVERVVGIMLAVPFKWVNVPITVEVSVGSNWADMKEAGTFRSDKWFARDKEQED